MATRNIVPRADSEGELGTSVKNWGKAHIEEINADQVKVNNGAGNYLQIPTLTTTQRDALTPINGMIIYNSTTSDIEKYEDAAWSAIGVGDHGLLTGLGDDDHTQYQKESEKSAASGYASLDANTKIPTVELGGAGADDTKYLRGDQSWQVPAGGGAADFFDTYLDFLDYNPSGWGISKSAGAEVTFNGNTVYLATAPTTGTYAQIYHNATGYYVWTAGKKTTVEFSVRDFNSITAQEILFYFGDGLLTTSNGIGFRVVNADLFARNANGVTETVTDTGVDIVVGGQLSRYKAVVIPGTNCKFYVNGVLKATHTTNLPDPATYWGKPQIQIKTTEAVYKYMYAKRTLIELQTY